MNSQTFYSNGKLLITGEYLVIDGANALAIPTKKGQSLVVEPNSDNLNKLIWKSWTHDSKCWLEVEFSIADLSIAKSSDSRKAVWLQNLLQSAKRLSPLFLAQNEGINVNTKLDFPRDWGLGSSSTLINNIAQWAEVDPFDLHFSVSTGSGYDIACAATSSPIIYNIENKIPSIKTVDLNMTFKENIFFVHLNQKQDSFEAVSSYTELKKEIELQDCVQSINKITDQFITATSIEEWGNAMNEHEYLISNILQQETVKEKLFQQYPNAIKSLGAWGGDFVMAIGTKEDITYFKKRGYETVTFFDEILLNASH